MADPVKLTIDGQETEVPPGTTVLSRCFRISTGASRETREISPNTNSSATRSPSTVTVTLGNDSTIFLSRAALLSRLVMRMGCILPPTGQPW